MRAGVTALLSCVPLQARYMSHQRHVLGPAEQLQPKVSSMTGLYSRPHYTCTISTDLWSTLSARVHESRLTPSRLVAANVLRRASMLQLYRAPRQTPQQDTQTQSVVRASTRARVRTLVACASCCVLRSRVQHGRASDTASPLLRLMSTSASTAS